jgi:AraC-like DNA-binding protein
VPRLTATALVAADGLQLRRVVCDGVDGVKAKDEGADAARIIFVLRGRFIFQDASCRAVASPAAGVFLRERHTYRIRHIDGGDLCVAMQGDVCGALIDEGPVLRHVAAASYLRVRNLVTCLARGDAVGRLAAEETLATALAISDSRDRVHRRDVSIAEAIAYRLERDVDARQGLGALARTAGVSVFHACRVFKRVMGVGMHRYQQEIRLRHALACLLETDRPIAQIAVECGFANQGHFTNLCRRRFGSTPARIRAKGRWNVSAL